ncbi:MAG: O-antigen ligase family protein [Oligoflexia bacterium]|nr:O-antigen ligase family protein [Oligoflexia bacterium]
MQRFFPQSILGPAVWGPFTVSAYGTDRSLLLWMTYAAAIWCTALIFDQPAAVRRLFSAVFLLGCVVAVVGLIQMAQHRLAIYGVRPVAAGEPFGPYYNRDHAASMLIMAVFCGVGLFWDRVTAYRAARVRPNIFNFAAVQITVLFGVGVLLLGVFHTLSRGALGALLITSAVLALIAVWSSRHRFVWLGLGMAVFAAAVAMSPVAGRLTGEHLGRSAAFRLSIYRGGLELVRDFPLFGSGLGALRQAYAPYQSASIPGVLEHVHSDWLELLIQTGVVGLALYSFGLLLYLRSCLRAIFNNGNYASFGLACGSAAALLAFMLHGLVEFSFQIPANAVIFFVIVAALGSLAKSGDKSKMLRPSVAIGGANIVGAICAVILAAVSAPQALASWHHLTLTDALTPTERVEKMSKAIALDAKPRYYFELARELAAETPVQSGEGVALLRKSLGNADAAVRLDPASPRYRNLQGNLLWRLGRVSDGEELIKGR